MSQAEIMEFVAWWWERIKTPARNDHARFVRELVKTGAQAYDQSELQRERRQM